jgi:signal transduction histidine kinase
MGLRLMDEQVRLLGGLLSVASARGAGTTLSFTVPAAVAGLDAQSVPLSHD